MVIDPGIAQAAPAAGTIISNQAAASYTDGRGIDRVSQSNAVETLVRPSRVQPGQRQHQAGRARLHRVLRTR